MKSESQKTVTTHLHALNIMDYIVKHVTEDSQTKRHMCLRHFEFIDDKKKSR